MHPRRSSGGAEQTGVPENLKFSQLSRSVGGAGSGGRGPGLVLWGKRARQRLDAGQTCAPAGICCIKQPEQGVCC